MGSSATVGRRSRRRERSTPSSGARPTNASRPRPRVQRLRLRRRPHPKPSPRPLPRPPRPLLRSRRAPEAIEPEPRPAPALLYKQPSRPPRETASSSIPRRCRPTTQALPSAKPNGGAGSTPMNEIGRVNDARDLTASPDSRSSSSAPGMPGFRRPRACAKRGSPATSSLLSAENGLPYQRPPLSKAFLKGEMDVHGLPLRAEAHFRDQRIDLRLGVGATRIDRAAQQVELSDGERDRLRPSHPGDRRAAAAARRSRSRSAGRLRAPRHRRRDCDPRAAGRGAQGRHHRRRVYRP